jgi:hypothetical protein
MDMRRVAQVLRALEQGHELSIQEYTYAMAEDGDLLYVLQSYPDGDLHKPPEKKYLGCDLTVGQFIRLVQGIPEEQMTLIGANTVLTDIHREGGPFRLSDRQRPRTA